MKKKVLVTYHIPEAGLEELIQRYEVTFPPEGTERFKTEQVKEIIGNYDALLPTFALKVDREIIERGHRLKIISNYGVGYDNIDVEYATLKGIQVTNTPDPVTEPTADLAMGLLLDVSRKITQTDRNMRLKGKLTQALLENLGHSLYGKTIGIIGMGRIGQALARRAVAAGMKVIYHNRKPLDATTEKMYRARYATLDELLTQADVVSLNAPLTSETHHLIGKSELQKMKKSAILINTARGPLIDEKALIEALKDGIIWGAGLDVFEFRDRTSPELLEMDQVVVTPHIGTQTYEAREEMGAFAARNIIHFFENEGPVAKVNLQE